MGKLSDALRKSLLERDRQKQEGREKKEELPQARVVGAQETSPEYIQRLEQAATERKDESLSPRHQLKNRFLALKDTVLEYTKSAVYVAREKDSSGVDPRVVTYYNYHSPVADQYRVVRTNLKSYFKTSSSFSKSSTGSSATRLITVSSALHGEGKSITAANLAIVFAHDLDSKVLIVDSDLRKGSICKLFNMAPEKGLSDILGRGADYKEAIYPAPVNNLFVLPSGKMPAQPLELLSSKRMKLLFEQLRSDSFTHVLIDTPPLSLFSDAGVIAAETDGIVFIVQAHKTSAAVVRRAKESAEHNHAKIIGFVLTHADYHIPHVYGYYQYYKYYQREKH